MEGVTIKALLTRSLLIRTFFLLVACVPIIRCVCIQQLSVLEGAVAKASFQHGVGKLHRPFVVFISRKWCKRSYLVLSLCHYAQ